MHAHHCNTAACLYHCSSSFRYYSWHEKLKTADWTSYVFSFPWFFLCIGFSIPSRLPSPWEAFAVGILSLLTFRLQKWSASLGTLKNTHSSACAPLHSTSSSQLLLCHICLFTSSSTSETFLKIYFSFSFFFCIMIEGLAHSKYPLKICLQ